MYWLYLLLALGCFAFALKTPSVGLMTLCLLAALAFPLALIGGHISCFLPSGSFLCLGMPVPTGRIGNPRAFSSPRALGVGHFLFGFLFSAAPE